MPETTAELPHAITCIKRSVRDLLRRESKRDLTVSCDRQDCWSDSELFKWRQAINIADRGDFIGDQQKSPRENKRLGQPRTEADKVCFYEAVLNLSVQIYVEDCDDCQDDDDCCDDGNSNAYSILSWVTSVLSSQQSELAGRRILYKGSTKTQDVENEVDLVVISAEFEIHYLFDQTRPWVVG